MDDASREVLGAIEGRLTEAMGRFGIAGRVIVRPDGAWLEASGSAMRVDLGPSVARWRALSEAERQRTITELLRALSAARHPHPPVAAPEKRAWGGWLAAVLATAALVATAVALRPLVAGRAEVPAQSAPRPAGSPDGVDLDQQLREERAWRACHATSRRVARGATVGPLDTDGWVVELILLGRDRAEAYAASPELGEFVAGAPQRHSGNFIWPDAPELVAVGAPGSAVLVHGATVAGNPVWQILTLTFGGRYVTPYFTSDQRSVFHRVAQAMQKRLGATHGAIYARCAASNLRQLGSWAYGPSPGQAAAVLVQLLGSPSPTGDAASASGAGPPDLSGLEVLLQRASGLDRVQVATALGPADGMIAGARSGPSTITFPFGDGSRANRAALRLSRVLSPATPSP